MKVTAVISPPSARENGPMAYVAPTPADLKLRYAAFDSVPDDKVQYWLTDALRFVDATWIESDRAVAEMAYAAHQMALAGLGSVPPGDIQILPGVTRFKTGTMDVAFSEAAASAAAEGDFSATRYGKEYLALRRRSKGGPRLVGRPVAHCWPC